MYGYHFHEGRNVFIDFLRSRIPCGGACHIHLLALSSREWPRVGECIGQTVRRPEFQPGSAADLLCGLNESLLLVCQPVSAWGHSHLLAPRPCCPEDWMTCWMTKLTELSLVYPCSSPPRQFEGQQATCSPHLPHLEFSLGSFERISHLRLLSCSLLTAS